MADPPKFCHLAAWHRTIFADASGAVVLEYALIGGLVAIMAISALTLFAGSATNVWAVIAQEVGAALGG